MTTIQSQDSIWWHIYPLGFVGAEKEGVPDGPVLHRLGQLNAWMDYAVDLGVTGLALGPIFASSTHGYDTTDHFRIDPRLGDDGDFDSLIEAARSRGLRVLLDGVFNHVGRMHPAFQDVLRHGPEAKHAQWFQLSWPRGTAPGAEPDYACFEGHQHLVTLAHGEPEVADYVTSVMNHWLARGVDGWRLDAAYAVPAQFWAKVLPRVRSAHPGAYIFGEVIHGDYAAFVHETGMDSVTQYELWKAIWSSLNDRNLFELSHALERHNRFLDAFAPVTFVGNHDVTRIASQLADERHLPHALAILFTCGGTPSVYYGDERGLKGVKEHRAGGDDAVRPAFPAMPDAFEGGDDRVLDLHRQLISFRRRHAWLHRARAETRHLTNEHLVVSVAEGSERLFLSLNLSGNAVTLPVPEAGRIAAGGGALVQAGGHEAQVDLPAHGWAILTI